MISSLNDRHRFMVQLWYNHFLMAVLPYDQNLILDTVLLWQKNGYVSQNTEPVLKVIQVPMHFSEES